MFTFRNLVIHCSAMASLHDFVARGVISRVEGEKVVFQPLGTTYQLHLLLNGSEPLPPDNQIVAAMIRLVARKVWSVPSGGNFISPIYGPPRTIQGRVRWIEQNSVVVQAGLPLIVQLPEEDSAVDLAEGPIVPGVLVNVAALPGASIELCSGQQVVAMPAQQHDGHSRQDADTQVD